MSRIWKKPIVIPTWVDVNMQWVNIVVKWPKWELKLDTIEWVIVERKENELLVSVASEEKNNLWGLFRTLIQNMVEWVTNWYEKKLMLFWVWYNVKLQWQTLIFNLWYSHPINYDLPAIISAKIEKDPKWNDIITLNSIDKQLLWQIAAKIKTFRKIEPYKGKGIRYKDEVIKLKPWKTAKK